MSATVSISIPPHQKGSPQKSTSAFAKFSPNVSILQYTTIIKIGAQSPQRSLFVQPNIDSSVQEARVTIRNWVTFCGSDLL